MISSLLIRTMSFSKLYSFRNSGRRIILFRVEFLPELYVNVMKINQIRMRWEKRRCFQIYSLSQSVMWMCLCWRVHGVCVFVCYRKFRSLPPLQPYTQYRVILFRKFGQIIHLKLRIYFVSTNRIEQATKFTPSSIIWLLRRSFIRNIHTFRETILLSKRISDGCKLIREICYIKSIHLNSIFTFDFGHDSVKSAWFMYTALKISRDSVKAKNTCYHILFGSSPCPLPLMLGVSFVGALWFVFRFFPGGKLYMIYGVETR